MTQRASESLVAVLIRIGLLLALAILLMAENAQAQSVPDGTLLPAPFAPAVSLAAQPSSDTELLKSTMPLNEEDLRTRYVGKLIFLRGSYLGDNLDFDQNGRVIGSPATASFTLSAFEVRKMTLTKKKLEIEADRYGLHFLGALPFEDGGKPYDQVKISNKPVHISIDREPIVTIKAKKEKKTPESSKAPASDTAAALAAVSPAHSAMLMNKALDNIFAADLDTRMMAQLPGYWKGYFAGRQQHRPFMPADASIKVLSDGMRPPMVLNSIDPSSNEFAQKYGIAGMEMVRTVVDATGVPREMAISRPIGFGLDEKAIEAVRNSRFKPATVNGQSVPVIIDLVVTFRIYSNRTKPGSVTKDSQQTVLAASVPD